MPNRKPIVVVGSINIDLVARAQRIPVAGETVAGLDFQTHPGGKGANQAVAVARLGYPVSMIGRTGDDAFGEQLREGLLSAGIDVLEAEIEPQAAGDDGRQKHGGTARGEEDERVGGRFLERL